MKAALYVMITFASSYCSHTHTTALTFSSTCDLEIFVCHDTLMLSKYFVNKMYKAFKIDIFNV